MHYATTIKQAMRRDNLNILITLDEWLASGLSYKMYEHDKQRGHLQAVGRACNGREVEIIWESIRKEKRRAAVIKKWGDPAEAVKVSRLEAAIKPDPAAYDFYHTYIVDDESGRKLKKEVAEKYYASAIVLEAVHHLSSDHHAFKMALGNASRPKIWPMLTNAVSELNRTKYPHDIPANEKRLKERLKIYKRDGYESLIHGNFLNNHAAKVNDDTKRSILVELIANGRNMDNAQIMRVYNTMAGQCGWQKISASTVGNIREQYDLETYAGRHGEVAHYNNRAMQVKRSRPTAPLYFWTLDGWDVELLYQAKNSKGVRTYHNRPTVVVVLDPCMMYPIGFAVGTHETPELIQAAVRNAINHTAELFGSRHRAWQIQSDRYSIKTMMPYYEAAADKATPTRAKNAKGKTIEPWFGRELNRKYCQMMDNWSGFGVKTSSERQPNTDMLNAKKHRFPDFNGACMQVVAIISDIRARLQEQYAAAFDALPADDKLPMTLENFLYHFGAVRIDKTGAEIKNRLEGPGMIATIDGVKHTYDCFDMAMRKHYAQAWTVKYDPDNLSQVLACNEDGSLRFMLEEKYVQPMALKDRKDGDASELQRIREFNNAETEYISAFRAHTGETTAAFLAEHPELNDTLAKHLLSDSTGQHKNQRNAKRLAPVVEMAEGEDEEINIFNMM